MVVKVCNAKSAKSVSSEFKVSLEISEILSLSPHLQKKKKIRMYPQQ